MDSDFELHAMIVHMSGNILYEEIYQMVQKLIRMHITELFNERIKESLNRMLNVSSAEEYLYGIS